MSSCIQVGFILSLSKRIKRRLALLERANGMSQPASSTGDEQVEKERSGDLENERSGGARIQPPLSYRARYDA
jgi:hypothetical protein